MPWTLLIAGLLVLAVCAPLVFGVPVLGNWMAMDANFALQLVNGYAAALHAHEWFPRWLPSGNGGLGSPAFYFYGRFPFLIAGLIEALLRLQAPAAVLFGIAIFRAAAFFACRTWLRGHVETRAADCGALLFVALPYAMSYNPLNRVGFAEVAATAFFPLLLCAVDRMDDHSLTRSLRSVVFLALCYALLAATHLPQTVLAIGVTTLYALLARGVRATVVSIAGAVAGILLSAPSVLPAVQMQPFITSQEWTGNPYVDVRDQFLFTLTRFHLYHFLVQELYLYGTWVLCLLVLAPFFRERYRADWGRRASRAILLALLLSLLAMTELFWPMWVAVPQLRALQFPWRLFPAAMTFAAGALALIAGRSASARTRWFSLPASLILFQFATIALGDWVSLSGSPYVASVPNIVAQRIPNYVPWAERSQQQDALRRSFVPEYIPASAHKHGWQLDASQTHVVDGSLDAAQLAAAPLPGGIVRTADGGFSIRGRFAENTNYVLPSFFFPDVESVGAPQVTAAMDRATGLTRITIKRGVVRARVDHGGKVASVREADRLSLAAAVALAIAAFVSLVGRRRRGSASPLEAEVQRRAVNRLDSPA